MSNICEMCDGTGCPCLRMRDWQSMENGCLNGCPACGRNSCGHMSADLLQSSVETTEPSESSVSDSVALSGDSEYFSILEELRELHSTKSATYGTPMDYFSNFTSVASATKEERFYYAMQRALEKLTRAMNIYEYMHLTDNTSSLGEEFLDIASLMICAEAMRRYDEIS